MSIQFYQIKVKGLEPQTQEAYSIVFEDYDKTLFNYLPGQYLTIRVKINGQWERRSYSLSTAPNTDENMAVTIKTISNGLVSNYLKQNLLPGDTLEVYPPMGNFVVNPNPANAKHYLLCGGGSGITPLMSMLKAVLATEPNSKVTLLYANRNEKSIIFKKQLENLSAQYGYRLNVTHILSRPENGWQGITGHLSGELAQTLISQALKESELPVVVYLCGPQGLMDACTEAAQQAGIASEHIYREYYNAPVTLDEEPEEISYELVDRQIEVEVYHKKHTITVIAGQNVLDAAIEANLDPPYSCKEGICTTCRARLNSGYVHMEIREGLSDEELAAGYVLTCQCYPLTDDVSLSFG